MEFVVLVTLHNFKKFELAFEMNNFQFFLIKQRAF